MRRTRPRLATAQPRPQFGGPAERRGDQISQINTRYRAGYSHLPTGYPVGTAEEALDTACGLYLNDPTAWT